MCHAGIIGSAPHPGGAPGAVPGVAPHRTRGNVRTGAPGAGIGIEDGRGRAAGTREGLAHGTESVKDVQGVEKGNGAEREDDPGAERGGAQGAGVEGDGLDPPVRARLGKQKTDQDLKKRQKVWKFPKKRKKTKTTKKKRRIKMLPQMLWLLRILIRTN